MVICRGTIRGARQERQIRCTTGQRRDDPEDTCRRSLAAPSMGGRNDFVMKRFSSELCAPDAQSSEELSADAAYPLWVGPKRPIRYYLPE